MDITTATKIASISIGDEDTLWLVRHYTGLGALQKYVCLHVIRKQKLLGRFNPDSDTWVPAEHPTPATPSEVISFQKARIELLKLTDAIWK